MFQKLITGGGVSSSAELRALDTDEIKCPLEERCCIVQWVLLIQFQELYACMYLKGLQSIAASRGN